jgi:hypothetical protein
MAKLKSELQRVARKIEGKQKITVSDLELLLHFEQKKEQRKLLLFLRQAALPLSLLFGFFYTVFAVDFDRMVKAMPSWTNLPPDILTGVDYLWNLLGEPVGKENILYHIPNIILYSFGIFGIKKLFDALDKRSWLDRVLNAQVALRSRITNGDLNLSLKRGHSLLFVGKGDFIGMQFALNHTPSDAVTISETKPPYTDIWNYYFAETLYDDLKHVIEQSGGENAGEYIFFPVKDDQIFLPGPASYDLSPHKLDILCQNIRTIEKEERWKPRRIIIVGDKFHTSFVQSEDRKKVIPKSEDTISLSSIAKKYPNVTVLDPTDIVLREVITIAKGRKIVFRATKQGIKEYKERFYKRLRLLGYKETRKWGVLTIGYDLFEDQTEQQTLARKIDDYYPIVLSKNVHDALIRNGYKKSEFIYVPDLVIATLTQKAAEQ